LEAVSKPNTPNYEYRVGLFAVIALMLLFWGWAWLRSFSLHPPQRFKVQFHDIAGLTKNAPVQVNGVRVGTVEKIELSGEGQVLCSLAVPVENTTIPQGSTVTIQTLGLVGAKYVEISLPKFKADETPPPPIEADAIITGQDPVRVELHMNRIATNFSRLSDCFGDSEANDSISKAVRDVGPAMGNIKDAAFKFRNNMDRLSEATTDIRQGAVSARGFFNQGQSTMLRFSDAAKEWQSTGHKINHLIDEPSFNSSVKQTVQMAKETASRIQEAIHELNGTLADKEMRGDIIAMLGKLTDSTENINRSMQVVRQLADDKGLRSDLKEAMTNAKDAMNKANEVLSNPNLVTDARETMTQLRAASAKVSKMATTIDKLLSKKHPLMRMLFSSAFDSSEKTEVVTKIDKKIKKGEPTVDESVSGIDANTHEKTQQTKVKQVETTVDNIGPPPDTEAQMHGEIK
jgi:phospholipid/cholesterol/gamma-HCH transport system substrate-binding protein